MMKPCSVILVTLYASYTPFISLKSIDRTRVVIASTSDMGNTRNRGRDFNPILLKRLLVAVGVN